MSPEGHRQRTTLAAHGDHPIPARGDIPDYWSEAQFGEVTLLDFVSPARLVESLLIAAAGIAEQIEEPDAHVHSARAYAARVARALDAQAEDRVLESIADAVSEGVES